MRAGRIAFCESVADAVGKERLGGLGYAAVEMESELFKAATGDEDGDFKPVFTQIRCISDATGMSIPAPLAESAMDRETGALKLSPWAALKEILRNPSAAVALVKFAKAAARAQKRIRHKNPAGALVALSRAAMRERAVAFARTGNTCASRKRTDI